MDVKIHMSTRDVVLASWERVALGLWRGKTTVGAVRKATQLLSSHATELRGPLLLLTLTEEQVPLPTLEARMELVSFLKSANGLVERHAIVFEGEGFRAASIRAVVAGVSLFSRPEFPSRVFGSIGAAARFLGAGSSSAPPHRVLRLVNEARRNAGTQTLLPWLNQPGQAASQQVRR